MKIRYYIYLLLFFFLSSCNQDKKVRTIKLAHGLNVDHPVHKAMEYMGKVLEENSGGKMKLKIYPSQQLGTERQCIELLQIGSLDMTKVSAAIMENFSPDMK
ncbi:MAG: TRAP transporter substrate-binding protein, partial [Flavobacteriia bacterium]